MNVLNELRPVWLEINLDNLYENYKELRNIVDEKAKFMAIIKGNAYGHDAVEISRAFKEIGVDQLGVAMMSEAVEIRKANIEGPILVLGYTPHNQMKMAIDYDITQTIYCYEDAKILSDLAVEYGKLANIHIKIDSGMSRIGFLPNESSINEIAEIYKLPNLKSEGIFTHFATADEEDKNFTKKQYNAFVWVVEELAKLNVNFEIEHVSNGPAVLDLPEYNLDMVRIGVMLYGYFDSEEVNQDRVNIKKVMSLRARISNVKTVPSNQGISYGLEFVTARESVIATIPLGYADGYPRKLFKNGYVLVNDQKAAIVGRICMDQMMIDVTDLGDINIGDEVVIFGADHENCMQVEDIALAVDSIHAEVVSNMNRRIPRIYTKSGQVFKIKDYLLD